jgi:hypothetical protein
MSSFHRSQPWLKRQDVLPMPFDVHSVACGAGLPFYLEAIPGRLQLETGAFMNPWPLVA